MAKSKTEVNFMEHLKPLLPAGGDASELEAAAQALATDLGMAALPEIILITRPDTGTDPG